MPWENETFPDLPKVVATQGINQSKMRYQVNAEFGGTVFDKTEKLVFPPTGTIKVNGHYESTDGESSPQGDGIHMIKK